MKYKLLSILVGSLGLVLISRYVYGSDKYLGVFEITGYCNDEKCTGKSISDKGYGITKSGKVAKWGTVATDIKVIPLGTKLKIEGFGSILFEASDTGKVIKGNRIDIWHETHSKAKMFGRKKLAITQVDN